MSGFAAVAATERCPCGGGARRLTYGACCAPLHQGLRQAGTAAALMRSRYSAFARGEVDYLLRTQPSSEPEAARRRALRDTCRQVRWQRLEILATEGGGPADLTGTVTFRAHYRQGGRRGVLQERSRFGRRGDRLEGDWLYLEALDLGDGGPEAGVSG